MQPKTPETTELEATFAELAKQWIKETAFHSNDYFIVNHPAYRQIIEMGEAALPLIFREMEMNGGHWFWALQIITGANPAPEEAWGKVEGAPGWIRYKVREIQKAWLEWGREQGYRW